MNDTNVQNMQSYVEHQYLSTTPQKRLYLPEVLPEAEKRSVSKRKKASIVPMATVILMGLVVLPLAYLERGYLAAGGEWILLTAVYFGLKHIKKDAQRGAKKNTYLHYITKPGDVNA